MATNGSTPKHRGRPRRAQTETPPTKPPRVTAATISKDLRLMAMTSLNFLGGVKYLVAVAKKEPNAYLQFVSKCLVRDDESAAAGLNVVVQQLIVGADAKPVAGVLNSPIAAHVMPPPRLVANGGEVLDVPARDLP